VSVPPHFLGTEGNARVRRNRDAREDSPQYEKPEGVRCPGCNRYLRELDVFHARDCSSKQSRLEGTLWETMPLGGTETVTMKTDTKTEVKGRK